jgi:hypothetical protein
VTFVVAEVQRGVAEVADDVRVRYLASYGDRFA